MTDPSLAGPPPWDAWLDVDFRGRMPAHDHADRRSRIEAALEDLVPAGHSSALLVSASANVRWATGFTGSNGALVAVPGRSVLLTDARYEGRAATECPGLEVVIDRDLVAAALRIARDAAVDRLVFEGQHIPYSVGVDIRSDAAAAGLADVVSATGVVERLRSVKDDAELSRLARACAISELVLTDVLAGGLVGRTERELATAIEEGFRAHEADVGFDTIVAAGHNGAIPHHEPTSRVIDTGQLVTIDCGARVEGYHADTTRTLAAGARPSGDDAVLLEAFAAVAAAQQAGVEAAVVGATGGGVDDVTRAAMRDAGFGDAFVHGTGHGVGLDIHEAPAVGPGASATLTPRTALTVEPGAYLPGRGGVRIEDTVVVAEEGPARRLTHSPHDLLVV